MGIMVKLSGTPILRGVAFGTDDSVGGAAELSLMDVFMARLTLARGGEGDNFYSRFRDRLVAPQAVYGGMPAGERKLCG